MTTTEYLMITALALIAAETSYLVYKTRTTEAKQSNQDVLVDTSVLMDGRIVAIAETGFIPGRLVVPRSVIGELQLLADTGDSDKRERARRGLDVLKQLQGMDHLDVLILQDGSRANEGVDERLLMHAKATGASLATIDFNLNKVALVEGIRVLNVNELARNLRMSYLPGEHVMIELTTTGSDSHQAVGHLTDGTMVVVEHAKKYIGTSIEIEIIRSLQTAAGRMMFARPLTPKQPTKEAAQKPPQVVAPAAVKPADTKQRQSKRPQASNRPRPETSERKPTVSPKQNPSAQRRRTSTQREASFIRLIDEQEKK